MAPELSHCRRTLNRDAWGELYPFDSHYLEVRGCRYHYLDESPSKNDGHAPTTLLFVHGNPTWSFHWRHLILAQRGNHRCVAVDHLGCGLSDLQPEPLRLSDHIDNLVQLIEALDLEQVTLVAQDWGGAIGLGALLRKRSRFQRLLLLNTGAYPPWFIPWRIRACRWPVLGRLAVQGCNAFSLAALRMTLARTRRLDSRVEQAYLAPYSSWAQRAAVYQFVRDIPLDDSHPTWQTLAQIEAGLPQLDELPIQLIWGMKDWCFTPECLTKFVEVWPEAEVQRLTDAGHWVLEDAPEQCASLVTDWLRRSNVPASGAVS